MIAFEYLLHGTDKSVPVIRLYDTVVEPFNRIYRKHMHTAFEISVCCCGSGIYRVNENIYTITPGDVFFFAGNVPHCITQIDDGEIMTLTTVQFEPRFLWAYGEYNFDLKYLGLFNCSDMPFEHKFSSGSEVAQRVSEYLFEMKREYLARDIEYEYMIRSALSRLMIYFIRKFGKDLPEFSVNKQSIANLNGAMNYIDENFSSDISLEAISDISGMSRNYFCTLFKKLNGLSPWDYITIRRVEKSLEYIKNTDLTMLEIACLSGYNNTANFNRAFKKITGRIPSDYRK